MQGTADNACQRNCWMMAAAAGVLLALLLRIGAHYALTLALFMGLMLFAVLGALLSWAFCTGARAPVELAPPAPVRPMPLPPQRAESPVAPAVAEAAHQPAPQPIATPMHEAPAADTVPKPRRAPAAKPADAPAVAARAARAKAPVAAAVEPASAPRPRASGMDAAMGKSRDPVASATAPLLLAQPRDGKGDDLKAIRGIGPALESLLHDIGVWHFDQIAAWKARDIAFVDSKMEGFKGRITRDEWVKQARALAQARKGGGQ